MLLSSKRSCSSVMFDEPGIRITWQRWFGRGMFLALSHAIYDYDRNFLIFR
jgi:hypothetical protein